jgi:hypothetical protein
LTDTSPTEPNDCSASEIRRIWPACLATVPEAFVEILGGLVLSYTVNDVSTTAKNVDLSIWILDLLAVVLGARVWECSVHCGCGARNRGGGPG